MAVRLAPALGAEILSLDSMKVYRGMDIGTAKAPPDARARVPHHLVDLADPGDRFSTRDWLSAAEVALADIRDRGRRPLFVGGTALYLKALLSGLFEGPPADLGLRERLAALPPAERWAALARLDPEAARRIHPNDARRIVRALEVATLTGRPASDHRRQWEDGAPQREARLAGLRRSREDLYRRIDRRIDEMLRGGLVEEVRGLLARPGGLGISARQALGYKEIADYLEGAVPDLEAAVTTLRRRTRTFVRRQDTWFRRFPVRWVAAAPDDTPETLAPLVREALGL